MADPISRRPTSGWSDWARRYPPLVSFVLALLIAFLVLPSALTLPNANPSTVLEYAPVPPQKDEPPPPQNGSISSLGLGVSSTVSEGGVEGPGIGPIDAGKGAKPITKRCVGKPLRQTEDPNSPPCVPYFEGDNGGETWTGITKDEIRVLVYESGFISDTAESEGGDTSAGEQTPSGAYCDIDEPSDTQTGCQDTATGRELSAIAAVRAYSRYFNERFQTYNRHVHFYVHWTGSTATPASRRADAADNYEVVKPFAVIEQAFFGGYNDVYAEAITRKGVMLFSSFGVLANATYRKYAPNFWSFWPDVEHWADLYVSYICTKVKPFPVSHAGGTLNGQPRKYGVMYTTDPTYPPLQKFHELVEAGLQKCNVPIAERVTFPFAGYLTDTQGDQTYGLNNVAKLRNAGVTTVLWLGGMESKTTAAAALNGYLPEWIVAGDRKIDDLINSRGQDQTAWAHAWVVSQQLRESRFADSPGRQAYREADPSGRQIVEYYATLYYRDFFQTMRAIQVAGPNLNPAAVDQGLHAIPKNTSTDPQAAACFYDVGDYSCAKDSHEAWWDPRAADPNGESGQGCWRMVREGKRYLAGTWEGGDDVFKNASDPCNGVKGTGQNRIG